MERTDGMVLRGALALAASAMSLLLGGVLLLGFLSRAETLGPGPEPPAADELPLFVAPSHVPPGVSWVILGSFVAIPEDIAVTSIAAGVSVLEVERLSGRAVAVRLSVPQGVSGNLIRASSVSATQEAIPELRLGQAVPSLAADANFAPEDFVAGTLFVPGDHFIYGYLEGSEVPLAGVRVHNRATGEWHRHEILLEKERLANEPAVDLAGNEHFKESDPLETLPDTDGDGILDGDEEPDERTPRTKILGVRLVGGENTLDLVAVDEAGNASWRTIQVSSSYVSNEEGQ